MTRRILAAAMLCAITVSPVHARHRTAAINEEGRIVAHPAGCYWHLFCGCGVAVWAFGKPIRDLWLARAWYRFPRDVARAGNVAIFGRHHVAGIIEASGDGTALLYDPNSGGHLTRIHRRSIAGATIVNPRGLKIARRERGSIIH